MANLSGGDSGATSKLNLTQLLSELGKEKSVQKKEKEKEKEKDKKIVHVCRICHNIGTKNDPLLHPCKCSGSIKYIHERCLFEWLKHQSSNRCEICHFEFKFEYYYNGSLSSGIDNLINDVDVLNNRLNNIENDEKKNDDVVNNNNNNSNNNSNRVSRKRNSFLVCVDILKWFLHFCFFELFLRSIRIFVVCLLWMFVFSLNTQFLLPFLPIDSQLWFENNINIIEKAKLLEISLNELNNDLNNDLNGLLNNSNSNSNENDAIDLYLSNETENKSIYNLTAARAETTREQEEEENEKGEEAEEKQEEKKGNKNGGFKKLEPYLGIGWIEKLLTVMWKYNGVISINFGKIAYDSISNNNKTRNEFVISGTTDISQLMNYNVTDIINIDNDNNEDFTTQEALNLAFSAVVTVGYVE